MRDSTEALCSVLEQDQDTLSSAYAALTHLRIGLRMHGVSGNT